MKLRILIIKQIYY